ncbi:MAG: DUF1501 domain-containing protein, partial [Burkholderiales bacterium]|nr:DUF1501 domain-containing protein [Opitutaceae bacterium]
LVQSAHAAAAPEKDRRILVLVQLAGGNDGLNTLVPFDDPAYHSLRPTLALKQKDVLGVTDHLGLHPACAPLHALMNEGRLGIVQNVGYPNPNRSHFRSTEIWETASESEESLSSGWIGRYLDNACAGAPAADEADPEAIHINAEVPQSFGGTLPHNTYGLTLGNRAGRAGRDDAALLEKLAAQDSDHDHPNNTFLRATLMDALVAEKKIQQIIDRNKPEVTYPGGGFAQSLRNVAGLIAAGLSTRVYFVSLGGFDTHANQANAHTNLLKNLSEGLAAFQKDITARGLDDQVLTMTFSEFGRRPNENDSRGTDHGTAAPLFVMGKQIHGPLHGTAPDLKVEKNADLTFTTDFRSVYATVLDRWLETPAAPILGAPHESLGFLG